MAKKSPPPASSTTCWDKAKWHADAPSFPDDLEADSSADHILAALHFLHSVGMLTARGEQELNTQGHIDTALLREHVVCDAGAFLDRAYSKYLESHEYGKDPPVSILQGKWQDYCEDYNVAPPAISPSAKSARAMSRLRAQAKKGSVSVEDLVNVAKHCDESVVEEIKAIQSEFGWRMNGTIPGSPNRWPPLGRWAKYVCVYLEGGYAALSTLALDPDEQDQVVADGGKAGSFTFSVLVDLDTDESREALGSIVEKLEPSLAHYRQLALGSAEAVNRLYFNRDGSKSHWARRLFHRLLESGEEFAPNDLCSIYCALRWVGDRDSIRLVRERLPLDSPYDGLEKDVQRAIEKRLSMNNKRR